MPVSRYAVFGHPVAHSLSPAIHADFGKQTGIALDYTAIDAAPEEFTAALERFGTDWFRELLAYEPAPVLQTVRQPILVLNGERDLQVPAGLSLPPIRTALAGATTRDAGT